jgi:GT2 family glycosyltransferase
VTELGASDLSVIIPTRRRWEILTITLAALERQTETGFETIVVVDGSDGPVPDLPGVRLVVQEHAGPGAARNRGVAASDRAIVLLLGDDMVPGPELVGQHVAHHRRDPRAELAVLGRVAWHSSVPRDRLHRWLDWSGALFDYRRLDAQGNRDAGWPRFYSCNASVKRELFVAAGGFDPDFFFDYEDLDFGWRLGRQNMHLVYEPAALTEHLHSYDWPAVQRRYESRARAERLMMSKHDWFAPWFRDQIDWVVRQPPASHLWTMAADYLPARPRRLRRAVRARANRHYLQRLAPGFLEAWEGTVHPEDPATAGGKAVLRGACEPSPTSRGAR